MLVVYAAAGIQVLRAMSRKKYLFPDLTAFPVKIQLLACGDNQEQPKCSCSFLKFETKTSGETVFKSLLQNCSLAAGVRWPIQVTFCSDTLQMGKASYATAYFCHVSCVLSHSGGCQVQEICPSL